MNEYLLKIEHLNKTYNDATPLKDVNLTVNPGEVISLIGPSGTGKSTLLRMINRLENATFGKIYLKIYQSNDICCMKTHQILYALFSGAT